MKRRRRSITDLSNDLLNQILILVAKSSNGPLNFARTIAVCRLFRELAQDKMVLTAVAYNNASLPLSHPSFWQFKGLAVRCMCIGNETAIEIEIKYSMELTAMLEMLKGESALRMQDLMEKSMDARTVNTRFRCKALVSAAKKCIEQIGHADDIVQKLVQQAACVQIVAHFLTRTKFVSPSITSCIEISSKGLATDAFHARNTCDALFIFSRLEGEGLVATLHSAFCLDKMGKQVEIKANDQ